jgi:CDP-paratose 2-epimerase
MSKLCLVTGASGLIGSEVCYYSDLRKMQSHYPKWKITRRLSEIFEEIATSWRERLVTT